MLRSDAVIESPYTVRNLVGFIARHHQTKAADHKAEYEATAREILAKIDSNSVFKGALNDFRLNNKAVYTYNSVCAAVASRLIIRNLKLNARVKALGRSEIVSSLISSLSDGVPYKVYRYDIVSFYESINRDKLLSLIRRKSLCSNKTLELIESLFQVFNEIGVQGLPRGLDVSAYLSELYLADFDEHAKRLSHVSFYARFVDDIVVITNHIVDEDITSDVRSFLSDELTLHEGDESSYKRGGFVIGAAEPTVPRVLVSKKIDYLGYEFKIFNCYSESKDFRPKRMIEIDISSHKVAKIKSRISKSFLTYCHSRKAAADYTLLARRIKALTGNYEIHSSGTNVKIKTGIYYNYHFKTDRERCSLYLLDAMLKRLLFSTSHPLNLRIVKALSLTRRRALSKFSFYNGFYNKIYYSFSYQELKKIRKGWS
jgi:hypothetical protein